MLNNNRIIKFRAWDKREQKWYHKVIEWVFGRPKGSIGQLPKIPKDIVFMQYTGLKDFKGVEIYEGDIIKWENSYEVQWKVDKWILIDRNRKEFLTNHWDRGEIIGNIMENPGVLDF